MDGSGTRIATADSGRKSHLTEPPILVVQTAFLGDLLLSIPMLRRLRLIRPNSPIFFVGREGATRVLKDLEVVDEVFEIQKGNPSSYRETQSRLSKVRFEWIICPHESFTSAKFSWGVRAHLKTSFKHWWNFLFFKERVSKDFHLPEALRQMQLLTKQDPELASWIQDLKSVDLRKADLYGRLPQVPLWASASLREKLLHRSPALPADDKTICLFPGSVWATKRWTEESFIELAERLVKEGFHLYWLGSKDEMPMTKRLEVRVKGSRSVAGQLSLYQTLVLLSHSRVTISNDSAGGHLAAVAGAPTVSIFGPTILDFGFRPWNSNALVAELFDIRCRPCGKHGHNKCPIGTHECMKRLPVNLVHQRIHQLL